ncbi:hypothetical protein MMC26_005955 [Xylographa opegraphella]|nr:hypothetical protein [Xylographa opegraphella]
MPTTGLNSQNLLHCVPLSREMNSTTIYMEKPGGQLDRVDRQLLKQINHYVRAHPFITESLHGHTTTQRRTFERDIYDYARTVGLAKEQAKVEVRRARAFCGELDYDSDDSMLGNEIDDSGIISNGAILETTSAPTSRLAESLSSKHVSKRSSQPLVDMTMGEKGSSIDEIGLIGKSAIEIRDMEDDSREQQMSNTSTHERKGMILNKIPETRPLEAMKKRKECRPNTVPITVSNAKVDHGTPEGAVDTFSAPLRVQKATKRSKKHKTEDGKPASGLSTSSALTGDRQRKKAKKSSREVTALTRVSDNQPFGPEKQNSPMNMPPFNDSHTRKSRKIDLEPAEANNVQSTLKDKATATQEAQTRKEKKKKRKVAKADVLELPELPSVKTRRSIETTDPIFSTVDIPFIANHEDGATNNSAIPTPSVEIDGATIKSDGKPPTKQESHRKIKKEGSKEQTPSSSNLTNKAPSVELLETHAEASKPNKRKIKSRLPKKTRTSADTAAENYKEKHAKKSRKRKDSSLVLQEQQGVNGQKEVGSKEAGKPAGMPRKHCQVDSVPMIAPAEGEDSETEEEICSEYFTPTRPKVNKFLLNSERSSEVNKQEASPSKAKSNPKMGMGMEEKRRSYYAELRRRSSLGITLAGSEDKMDTTAPVAELDVSTHIDEPADEEQTKGEVEKTKNNMKHSMKSKKRNSTGIEKSSGMNRIATGKIPVMLQAAQTFEQDQEIAGLGSTTEPSAMVSKKEKKKAKKTTGTALTGENNEHQALAVPISKTATPIDPDLDIPVVPLPHSAWNPVNQAVLDTKNFAESFGSQSPCPANGSELCRPQSYINDPMELDPESWAVTSDHEAGSLSGPGKVSRKRKKRASVKKHARDISGTINHTKKPRLVEDGAGIAADFSSPMIR